MKLLDERGIGTVWSICKEKFALVGHTHNYAGSGSPGGSANSAIGVVDYNQTGKTIQIGYSGTGITGDQIKYIAGYTDGSGNVNAKIKNVSKDALKSWLGLGSLAYSSSSIPTKLSQLNNDKGFVTGSVSGNTVTINGASTTWTNTWRGIQDNLTSTSTSESLSANQGKVLKGLIDSKANSSDLSSYVQKNEAVKDVDIIKITQGQIGVQYQYIKVTNANGENKLLEMHNASNNMNGFMSLVDKAKLDGIEQGANYYTLPTASNTTLGGIKTGYSSVDANKWAVEVDDNSRAYVPISGLVHNSGNVAVGLTIGSYNTATYNAMNIFVNSQKYGGYACYFPTREGTFALTSDIPTKTSQLTNDSGFLKQRDFECTINIYLTDTQLSYDKLKGANITIEQQGEDVMYAIWDGSPISFTANAKVKIKISVSHVNGYITPNAVEFKTVIGRDEDITLTYTPITLGVYIYDTDGHFILPDNWDSTNNSKAVGVYVGTENSQFIIAPTYENDTRNWGAYGTVSGIITSDDSVIAKKDYAGEANTNKIIKQLKIEEAPAVQYCRNYTFKNGKKGYLWSLGEACEVYNNRIAIDKAMIKIGGYSIYSAKADFWTSTQVSSSQAWAIDLSGITDNNLRCRDKYSGNYVRAVCYI